MILAALILAVCSSIPYFPSGSDGPVCTPTNQVIECQCSECMTWDGVTQSLPNTPTWYDVERTNPDGTFLVIGGTWALDWLDEDNVKYHLPPSTYWCFAKDSVMPQEGFLYGYRVRVCNLAGCSDYFERVEYMTAPYAINQFQPPVVGN